MGESWSRTGARAAAAVLAVAVSGAASAATFTATGVVRDEFGQGVANVDLDFVDTCTGDSVFLVNDRTAADGSYSVVVNEGTYDIRYTPPSSVVLAAAERNDYVVAASSDLGVTVLHPGAVVSGTVRNASGAGVGGVDLKWVDVGTGRKVYFGKDLTTSAGTYAVRVRPGTYDVEYRPPAATTYATSRRRDLAVGGSDVGGLVDVLAIGLEVRGNVRDHLGSPVDNVDLNFYDVCTGEKVPTAHDNTDVQGNYTVYVPAATYSIHYNPPACRALAAERLSDQKIDKNTGIGNVTLPEGLVISGRVLDDAGVPLPDAKLKFYDAAKGTRQGATRDDSGPDGRFAIYLPAGTWDVNVEAPSSRDLLVTRIAAVTLTADTDLGDIVLAAGSPVSGRVLGPGEAPVRNVNVNAVDSATRRRVRLAHDSSAVDGTFRVVLPDGTFDVQYAPPACTGLAPASQRDRVVAGPTDLPAVHLVVGAHATGLVVDDAAPAPNPVRNVDLDFYPAGSTLKSYTPNDSTASDGTYDVVVEPSSYDVDYVPPAGSRLRPTRRTGVGLFTDAAIPDTVLASGWIVSGRVVEQATGLAVAGVRVEVYVPGAIVPEWTPHNRSALDGTYSVAVDSGTWDLRYVPAVGSTLAPRWRRGVGVAADVPLPDTALLPLTVPVVSAIAPTTGSTAGGTAVTIAGAGFQPDAVVRIGGVTATGIVLTSETSIATTTAAHPAGRADVEVVNPGDQAGVLAAGFEYAATATPVRLTVSRSGGDVVLSWGATGQPAYTVFRSPDAASFGDKTVLGATSGTAYTDAGGASVPGLQFYQVD